MKSTTIDRISWMIEKAAVAYLFFIGALVIGLLFLFAWGYVETVQWITSK